MILSHLKISSVANTVLKRAFNADICEGQRRGMEARYYAYMQICMCEKNASCIFTVHCLPTPIPFVASVHPVRFLHYIASLSRKKEKNIIITRNLKSLPSGEFFRFSPISNFFHPLSFEVTKSLL